MNGENVNDLSVRTLSGQCIHLGKALLKLSVPERDTQCLQQEPCENGDGGPLWRKQPVPDAEFEARPNPASSAVGRSGSVSRRASVVIAYAFTLFAKIGPEVLVT